MSVSTEFLEFGVYLVVEEDDRIEYCTVGVAVVFGEPRESFPE